jgi:hypothetical protein
MEPASVSRSSDDLRANLEIAIARAADRINGQRSGADALDAKAFGALALAAAGIGTLAAVSGSLAYWWIPAVIMGLAASILGYVVWPRPLDVGPDAGDFHRKWGGGTAIQAREQMLADLLVSIRVNDDQTPQMVRSLKLGSALLTAGLGAAVIAAIRAHH